MNDAVTDLIPTRLSLLSRLKDWNDQESWKVFFDTYWRLIYTTAIRTGLTDAEAQDVVQETLISVSKAMPAFKYRSTNQSFKGWLLQLTTWRIKDQIRSRDHGVERHEPQTSSSTKTATVERVADPAGSELESVWEEEWKNNLVEVALARVKWKVDPKHYQIFDFYVLKKWPLSRVTRALRVNPPQVYLAKHRISALIKKEIAYLQTKPM